MQRQIDEIETVGESNSKLCRIIFNARPNKYSSSVDVGKKFNFLSQFRHMDSTINFSGHLNRVSIDTF